AYEVITAFFLEAAFLGVLLFGRNLVPQWAHVMSALFVAAGTLLSSFWILAANSWMQTPQGHLVGANGQFVPESWLAIVLTPSFPWRLMHTVVAAYLTTALVVGGVGAWHLLRDRTNLHARKMFSMAMWMAALVAPVQVLIGDQHGLNTLEHQPVKIMAMEGHYESHPEGRAPLYLFGIPNDREQRLDFAVGIPGLGSLILKHSLDAPLAGLDTVPDEDQPPAAIVFWSFRVMVGLGMLMFALGLGGLWARWRGTLYEWRLLHRFAVLMAPAGFLAVIAGWVTTEVGRQPFVVYGLLRTADAVSPLAAPAVATSLLAFVVVYFAVFGVGIWYMLRLMRKPPQPGEPDPQHSEREPIRTAGIAPGPAQLAREPEPGQ
ncbi:MAG TPA: cytochrome ubiquinol oxidase subunit I, partial [Croceibacterium sp.]|nr:cytochrome ubiquinol oxidase subunit I [Croceibacterium sp.]